MLDRVPRRSVLVGGKDLDAEIVPRNHVGGESRVADGVARGIDENADSGISSAVTECVTRLVRPDVAALDCVIATLKIDRIVSETVEDQTTDRRSKGPGVASGAIDLQALNWAIVPVDLDLRRLTVGIEAEGGRPVDCVDVRECRKLRDEGDRLFIHRQSAEDVAEHDDVG